MALTYGVGDADEARRQRALLGMAVCFPFTLLLVLDIS